MRLSSTKFALAAVATTGFAIYLLFAGSKKDRLLKESGSPGFRTVGENRLLNIVRRNKIRIGKSSDRDMSGTVQSGS